MGSPYIGTSGWSYPSWRPDFYPAGLANEDFLGFYAERFPSVELNSTGYRLRPRSSSGAGPQPPRLASTSQ